MGTMIVHHKVRDFDAWRPVYEEHEAVRREHGVSDVSLHRSADDPNDVVIVFRADDLAKAREFADSQDLKETMERAGVEGPPHILFLNDA